jgi:hypothetical protein
MTEEEGDIKTCNTCVTSKSIDYLNEVSNYFGVFGSFIFIANEQEEQQMLFFRYLA